jgi:hypothetical protein
MLKRAALCLGVSLVLLPSTATGDEKQTKPPTQGGESKVEAKIDWSNYATVANEVSADVVREWIASATVRGARCEGPIAILPAGSLQGTVPIADNIQKKLVARGIAANVATATGNAIGRAWAAWAAGYGTRMPAAFPPFAAYPLPAAPVHPAPPHPLRLGSSSGEPGVATIPLNSAIKTALKIAPTDDPADRAITAFTTVFMTRFRTWHAAALIQNLLGGGPSKLAPLPGPIFGTVQGDRVLGGPHLF